jgi:hypothetical protein
LGLEAFVLSDLYYEDLLNIPYKKDGNSVEGMNCYNLCRILSERAFNIEFPTFREPDEDSVIASVIDTNRPEWFERISKPESYCMVFFMLEPDWPLHMGFVLEDLRNFVHVLRNRKVTRARLDSPLWRCSIEGFYRWKKFK